MKVLSKNNIYLLGSNLISPLRGWSTSNAKKRDNKDRQVIKEEKKIEVKRLKLLTPTRATDDFIGGEERKAEGRRKRKKQGAGPQPIS